MQADDRKTFGRGPAQRFAAFSNRTADDHGLDSRASQGVVQVTGDRHAGQERVAEPWKRRDEPVLAQRSQPPRPGEFLVTVTEYEHVHGRSIMPGEPALS
jgi:hypothetical protein